MNKATPLPLPVVHSNAVPEPDLPLIHDRIYTARSYRRSANEILVRGQLKDQKPPGLFIADDPEPMAIHHMVVDLIVEYPTMTITDATVVMEVIPHTNCTKVTDHYKQLIGLSIARGFTHKVRELFGGPRGCSHTTALLQAMAPVAIQSIWSMRAIDGQGVPAVTPPAGLKPTPEQIEQRLAHNIDSCHVWSDNSEMVTRIRNGDPTEPPLWIQDRMAKLELNPEQ